jgi:hypothetical protein
MERRKEEKSRRKEGKKERRSVKKAKTMEGTKRRSYHVRRL